ncbi:MAG TPA: 2-hydroxyglutaryl-CoA dehydratase, partial [Ruminococcaceae bacterium]|nr:2-hydroxyglutaryl-CoA dehydratase [Oscillospiraceae bacterium]
TLLHLSLDEMNELASKHEKIYTIASRCGVFAKSDVQPLLNQGARKSDICASIFAAVANQTIAGLAQGRPIRGKVIYLGGPLTFLPELRKSFDTALKVKGVCPENSLY